MTVIPAPMADAGTELGRYEIVPIAVAIFLLTFLAYPAPERASQNTEKNESD